ncbi:hypothetical protein MMC18_000522 [Xylographa bjoerkii]|nr:hypothetical protein [Xylographa bjoerkii]
MSQKLRASCNACNQAKVKCSKSRPTCTRCAKHGEECVYSVSLRAGKRPAHRDRSNARFRKFTQPAMDSQGAHAKYTAPSNRPAAQDGNSNTNSQLQSPMPSPMEIPSTWMIEPAAAIGLMPMDGDMYLNMVDYETPSLMDTSALFDMSECSPSASSLPNSAQLEAFRENWYQHVPDPISIPPYAYHERQQSSHATSTSSSSISPTRTPATPVYSSACGCFKTILQTLSSLYILSSFPNLTFDVALARNKEAVHLCLAALECNCAAEASFGLLYISLIAKILSIYQSSCGRWSDQSSSSTSARITLGVYNLDREDEERIKMILVRMELRKVETLVARVKAKACQGDAESEINAFDALVSFLEGKLRAVSDALQTR